MDLTISQPDQSGHFGPYGGRYVAEILMPAVLELEEAFQRIVPEADFQSEFEHLLQQYAGRPTSVFLAQRLTDHLGGASIPLRRSGGQDRAGLGEHRVRVDRTGAVGFPGRRRRPEADAGRCAGHRAVLRERCRRASPGRGGHNHSTTYMPVYS